MMLPGGYDAGDGSVYDSDGSFWKWAMSNEHDVPLEAHAYSAILKMGKISMMPLGGWCSFGGSQYCGFYPQTLFNLIWLLYENSLWENIFLPDGFCYSDL